MNLSLKLNLSSQLSEEPVRGILGTLFSEMADVMDGKQRSSFFVNFYRERLDSRERKEILWLLKQISSQFSPKKKSSASLNEQTQPSVDEIDLRHRQLLNIFQQVGRC